MSTTDGATEVANGTPTPKRTRSDKGKKRRDPASAGGALSSVLRDTGFEQGRLQARTDDRSDVLRPPLHRID